MKRILAILLALTMALGLGVAGFASGESSKDMDMPSEEATTEEDSGPKAAIVLTDDGEDTAQEQTEGFELSWFAGGEKTGLGISGFRFDSSDPAAVLLYSELSEDTGVFYTIGGTGQNVSPEELGVSMTQTAVDWVASLGTESFDSAVILKTTSEDSCEPVISAKGYTYLNIANTILYAEGDARSSLYTDVVGGTTVAGAGSGGMSSGVQVPVVVISNSILETTGAGEVEGAISVGDSSGRARGIQPQGKSITYLYNSAIVSRTWGAWSTDSARQSLDLVAYQSMGYSQNGYGAYADTSCRLFMYGSVVIGNDGIVTSNDGEIYAVSSDCDLNTSALRAIMQKTANDRELSYLDYYDESYGTGESNVSAIIGGQTAVQFHMPDMGGSGAKNTKKATLYMQGGALVTEESYITSGDVTAYTMRYAGACIVTKSTQVSILLEGVSVTSWSGELVHCMINSDSNVNNIADGDEAPGSDFTFRAMDVAGDIVNDDYQRALRLTLDATTLTGAIYSNTCEQWNTLCAEEFDGEYILNPDGYETVWGVELTLENGAVWNVTETSVVTALNVGADCTVNGVVTDNGDGTITVEPLPGAESSKAGPEAAGDDLNVTINGLEVGSFATAAGSVEDGYSVNLKELLAALGLELSYSEADGVVTVTDTNGILGALLGQ